MAIIFAAVTIPQPYNFHFLFRKLIAVCGILFITIANSFAQDQFIRTKDGRPILNRRQIITNCLTSLHKDRNDKTALSICECQANKLDRHFTYSQYRKYLINGIVNINALIKEDPLLKKEIQHCYINSGKTILLQAEGFENEFISDCMKNLQNSTEKKIDSSRLKDFCSCQLTLIKEKKISDTEMEALRNPNSLLFYEVMYRCGNPFSDENNTARNWNTSFEKDITGPPSDTVSILTLDGMTYIKVRIGSTTQIWLLDSGASDLVINNDMEAALKKENLLKESNYLGTGEYEMANGMIDTCRKYKVDSIQLGKFQIDNVVVAVTDKGKRILVVKGLLNKFGSWSLNNRDNVLILTK